MFKDLGKDKWVILTLFLVLILYFWVNYRRRCNFSSDKGTSYFRSNLFLSLTYITRGLKKAINDAISMTICQINIPDCNTEWLSWKKSVFLYTAKHSVVYEITG